MKKRILSVILSLIMLVSLVPATAITASAAGLSVSESAITVLKQLEGYSTTCNAQGYTGYGTLCTEKGTHGNHKTNEPASNEALREELADLSTAVNTFASRNGLSLSQSKHDALVLFSFQNGTAWTTGSGEFQSAIKTGATGSKFLSAICWWDSRMVDDDRRMIEANMYLNGVYSSSKPSRFIRVMYNTNGGIMAESNIQYYDTLESPKADLVPSRSNYIFMGWYDDQNTGHQVDYLDYADHFVTEDDILYAHWQKTDLEPDTTGNTSLEMNVDYTLEDSKEIRLYTYTTYDIIKEDEDDEENKVNFYRYSDTSETRGRITRGEEITVLKEAENGRTKIRYGERSGWVETKELGTDRRFQKTDDPDKTVKGDLKINAEYIDSNDVRWGRVVNAHKMYEDGVKQAEDEEDGVNLSIKWSGEYWIKLGDVDFETNYSDEDVIATATVYVNGYVNVRSDAGTDNQIVGALPNLATVDLYEITYVNGIRWGRCTIGWFCLSYAEVKGVAVDDYVNEPGVLAYSFIGDVSETASVYKRPSKFAEVVDIDEDEFDYTGRTISHLTSAEGYTWGKIAEGWVKLTNNADGSIADVDLEVAKYYTVVDGVTVRANPATAATRVDNLVKGVEFNVNDYDEASSKEIQVVVDGETIWGYANKVGEGNKTYAGWVNLASKYVSRGDGFSVEVEDEESTGLVGTIVGADKVNVRIHHATYSKILGKISRGTTVAILDEEDGWYKIDYDVDNNEDTDSWVVDTYVEVREGTVSGGSSSSTGNGGSTVETGLGIVSNTYTGVNVRTAPGTGNAQVGKLLAGSTVEILEVETYGASKWGRVAQGWVCMDYVTMVSNYEIAGSNSNSSGSAGSSTSTAEAAIYEGTTTQEVNIRKTTSLDSDIVRKVPGGTTVTVHEILTVTEQKETDPVTQKDGSTKTEIITTTSYWARVNDGYIYNPAQHISLDTLDEVTYTVTESDTLNVRSGAGTGNTVEYVLEMGDQVVVTQLKVVNGSVWGYVEADRDELTYIDEEGKEATLYDWDGEGWISLAYCTKGAISIKTETAPEATTPTTPPLGVGSSTGGYVTNAGGYRYTGKVVNTNEVNVRANPSTTATITTTLKSGAAMVVYETTIAENMAWGRCDAGWVYLYYVDLTPVVNGAVDARVVFNENTIAYTDMNCSSVAGTYSRMSVIDIYEVVGKMARTELGWVNTDNLL